MQRRPNASWHETNRGSAPLGQLLSMPQQLRPVRPRANLVEPPHNLPGLLHYGPQDRGPAQSSQYTGAVSQSPFHPVLNQQDQFVAPTYAPMSSQMGGGGGALSALAHALGIGGGSLGPPPPPPTGFTNPGASVRQAASAVPHVGGFTNPGALVRSAAPAVPRVGGFTNPGASVRQAASAVPPTPYNDLAAALARGRRGAYGV